VPAGRTCLEVRQGIESPTTLLHQPLHTTPVPPENFSKDRFGMPMDYRAWLTELEQLSRGGFVDAIKRAGFQGKPNSLKDAAEVPRQIEAVLEKMDFVSQFSAVRELHELIRVGGQSPERLGALARGYANLGLLTEFHWHPAHKAFTARSLVYAQRMVSSDKQAWRALWHRAYAFALAGLHQQALGDLQAAEKQGKAAAKDSPPPPAWVDLIDAYCRFDHARLKAAGEKRPERDLALLLWFDSVHHSGHKATTMAVALEVLGKLPDCYPAMDAVSHLGGVSIGHRATTVPFAVAGRALYSRVLAVPGLPRAAAKIAKGAEENPGASEESVVKEFQSRAKLIRALLDSGVGEPTQAAGSALPAVGAALDHGEPSWVCLGRLVSNLSFMHAWRRADFLVRQLGVPTDDFLKAAAPLVEVHPYCWGGKPRRGDREWALVAGRCRAEPG
jgi:hypothetical protein